MNTDTSHAAADTAPPDPDAKAGRLSLVNLTSLDVRPWLVEVLESGQPWYEEPVSNVADLERLLAARYEAYFVVCYEDPARRIARDIANGSSPSKAVAASEAEVMLLLTLYGKNFERMALATSDMLFSRYGQMEKLLASRSGIPMASASTKRMDLNVGETGPCTPLWLLHQLIALQGVSNPRFMRMLHSLQASSLLVPDADDAQNTLDSIYADLRRRVCEESEIVREERQTSLAERSRLVRERDGLAGENQFLQGENELLLKQLHAAQEQMSSVLDARKNLEEEIRLLTGRIKEKNAKLQRLSADRKRLQAELRLLYSSRSWRLTGPLRKSISLMRGRAKG